MNAEPLGIQSEVVPVDTHVYQIAIKHYGARGSLATKQALSPKLYDEIAAKLVGVWGQYAGWAHSVLFTADLKSFASYGLATPSPTPTRIVRGTGTPSAETEDSLPLPLLPPQSAATRKRRRIQSVSGTVVGESAVGSALAASSGEVSLADRVKRRRRVATSTMRGLG